MHFLKHKITKTILIVLIFLYSAFSYGQNHLKSNNTSASYVCLPCGRDCDKILSDTPGICASCHMRLVKKSSINFNSILPDQVSGYLKNHPNTVLLDVRTREEFEGRAEPNYGTLKNAINIPLQELESHLAGISKLKNNHIIVYCSHSHRSEVASYLLSQNGFNYILNMSGGISTFHASEMKK